MKTSIAIVILTSLLLTTGCSSIGGCYRKTAMHLLNADEPTKTIAKAQYPSAFGTIQEVIAHYKTDKIEYGFISGPSANINTLDRMLKSGYRVGIIIPSMPVDHAIPIIETKQAKRKNILEIHYTKHI